MIASRIETYFDRLWPICRSITGPGFTASLDILEEIMPMTRLKFSTGKKVHDWTIPKVWIPKAAHIKTPSGKVICDFKKNNLHLVGYSVPFSGKLTLGELKKHLYTLPRQPNAIPYITSYYKERWGFCLTHKEFQKLKAGQYEVMVDTELVDGDLVVGEAVLPGKSDNEILLSTYLCHPSMANNELSGPLVLSFLYEKCKAMKEREFTYRFVVVPETIGAVALLSVRGDHLLKKMIAGYQLTCVGDNGGFTYKKSRRGNSLADRAALAVLKNKKVNKIIPFNPAIGSDERQYCSPGYDLPVGSLMRTMYTEYSGYHTSLDNKAFMSFKAMEEMVETYFEILQTIEHHKVYVNQFPYGEPQLGPRGLFRSLSDKNRGQEELAMWWILNYCDGRHDLNDVADLASLPVSLMEQVARKLADHGLLKELPRALA